MVPSGLLSDRQVEAEVRILIDRLREVGSTAPFDGSAVKGRDPEAVIPRAGRNEQAMADYISTVAVAVLVRGQICPTSQPASPFVPLTTYRGSLSE